MLLSKYLNGIEVDVSTVPNFELHLDLIDISVVDNTLKVVAKFLSRATELSGVDWALIISYLLKHGGASSNLRKTIGDMVEWLTKPCPLWEAFWALSWFRLITLGKFSDALPIGIGNII